jgi:hypothetical protein
MEEEKTPEEEQNEIQLELPERLQPLINSQSNGL